mgnify:CR=1 FL=1
MEDTECTVSKWFVQEGKEIKQFDKVCEIHSKDSVETITSPYHGMVTKIYRKEGEQTDVGSSLMEINLYDPNDVEPNLEIYNGAYNPAYQS